MATLNIPFRDYSKENSSVTLPVSDAITDLQITSLFDATVAMSIGAAGQSTLNVSTPKDAGPGGNPANKFAQREMKWLCRYHDSVTLKPYTLEIPAADAGLLTGNTDFADLSAGAGLTFKTEFQVSVRASLTGNTVILDSAELVGRNL